MNTFSSVFGARLREERDRKGLSQAEFGAIGGVGKLAQLNYEKGERLPSAEYLHLIGKDGVDIDYLLFGVRSPILDSPASNAIQAALLTRFGAEAMSIPVDAGLLAEAIAGIDLALSDTGKQASPTRRARWASNLYLAFSKASHQERPAMKSAALLVVSEWIHSELQADD
jgi:transcriptional regulator with XRE-family HTH domain